MTSENGNHRIEDVNISGYRPLMSPFYLKGQIPLTDSGKVTVERGRRDIKDILNGYERKLLVVGPCSIHDVEAAKDYAQRLKDLEGRVRDKFVIVMRAYFEKPRTTVGWKGLIYEPRLDGQERINEGLSSARRLLVDIAELGLPTGTEFLDTFVPQYISDVISWGAIGARTVESQLHRQMASGLSMPIGFKNSTQGDIEVAVNAVVSARHPQWFFGLDQYGIPSVVETRGNPYTHIVLRGGNGSPNYDRTNIRKAQDLLRKTEVGEMVMVDCSHGNSDKDYKMQPVVFEDVIKQIVDGDKGIIGVMLESNIHEGNQKVPSNPKDLQYGVSVTDACIGWETTEQLVLDAYKTLAKI